MKRKIALAIFVLILCPLVFFLLSQTLPKRYTATMGLLVDQTIRSIDAGNPQAALDDIINFSRARSVQTQLDIITGSEVLGAAIDKATAKFPKEFPTAEEKSEKIQKLVNRLRVDISKDSDVIQLRVTSENPELSAEVANEIGYAFVDYTQRKGEESGTAAMTVINTQINASNGRLAEIDKKVANLKRDLGVADPMTSATGEEGTKSAIEVRRTDAEGDLKGTTAELAEAEAVLSRTPKEMVIGTGTQLNPQYTEVEAQLGRAKAAYEAAKAHYMDDHPAVQEQYRQVQQYESELKKTPKEVKVREDRGPNPVYTAQEQVVNNLRGRVKNLTDKLAQLNGAGAAVNARLGNYADLEQQLASLNRDKTAYEQNYLQLIQRKDLLEATKRGRTAMATIVSPALALNQPSFPDARLFFLMGVGLGVILAALIIMPKAPTEAYQSMAGSDRPALSAERAQPLRSDPSASALGESTDPNTPTS